jgi:GNAT superfamily N-acetyltransferase
MPDTAVKIRVGKLLSAPLVHSLFQRTRWHDWLSLDDVRWYLDHALYVVSAWDSRLCVGLGVLTGDGRINAWLDTIVVAEQYQRQGIGTAIVSKIVLKVRKLRPYYFGLDVYQHRTEKWYARFGFVRNQGSWLLEHKPTADRLRAKAASIRAARAK